MVLSALSQNIGWTGGSIALNSDFTMFNDYENSANKKYITTPLSISLTQPLFRYNALKWQKKTEPLKYKTAKQTFLSNIEAVHSRAVMNFFTLALAQINKQISEMNYFNADTLYRIANGRYKLGTIAEDELLQMQLSWLNAETAQEAGRHELTRQGDQIKIISWI